MKVTTEHVKGRGHYGAAVVLVDGIPVGHIIRPPARAVSRELRASGYVTANQPWRAYLGISPGVRLIGVYYRQDGGRDAAVAAVAGAHTLAAGGDAAAPPGPAAGNTGPGTAPGGAP
jgi:hypothetical protein